MSNDNARLLIVGLLNVESSFKNNTQQPASGTPDTVQFWLAPDAIWRIRTFATDHDIHIHNMAELPQVSDDFAEPYIRHIGQHYGDILTSVHIAVFPDIVNGNDIEAQLKSASLDGILEIAPEGYAFFNPDNMTYETQSQPD